MAPGGVEEIFKIHHWIFGQVNFRSNDRFGQTFFGKMTPTRIAEYIYFPSKKTKNNKTCKFTKKRHN
jgi:hypothetical protein